MTDTSTPAAWCPIATAPKDWEYAEPFSVDGRTVTLRAGRRIMVRGMCGDEELSVVAHWAQQEGFPNGATPHWWDLEGEGPIDWPITEWRELTAAEREALKKEGWD